MSSIRNAVHRRAHRERAQPLERQKLGLLEKHKDYALRAKDFNKKKKQIKNLKAKAADRNEDEFAFGMLSRNGPGSKFTRGKNFDGTVAGDRGNRAMSVEEVRLLKTQDVGYIRTVRNVAMKEARRLEERVVALGGNPNRTTGQADDDEDDWEDEDEQCARKKANKIIFFEGVDAREERLEAEADAKIQNDQADQEDDDLEKGPEALRAEQRQRLLSKLQKRLLMARKKLKILARAENNLELQRAKMAKTATVGGVTKSGIKFKVRERKR